MLITPSFLDILRDKVPLSALIGRKVKLTRRGHEYIGLCPFHHEKTPSFTINDEKGFYHCFGCGAHGDVVRYLTEAEKLPFMEAVETLANMAGVPEKMSDFFASKSTMRFLDISTMSLGEVNPDPADETVRVETYRKGDVYKKIVHRDGKIIGALLQGDLAYGGVLQQLIARQIDVRRVRKPLFDIDYSDFFHMHRDSYEFYYE